MSFPIARLSAAIAMVLFPLGSTAWAESGEPLGPAQPVHPIAEEQSAAPAIATTPEGRRVELYWANTADGEALIGNYYFANPSLPSPYTTLLARQDRLGVPAVAMSQYGYFVGAWGRDSAEGVADGVFARQYSGYGLSPSDEIKVNSVTAFGHDALSVVTNRYGSRYLVTWRNDQETDGSMSSLRGQMFDSQMQPLGAEWAFPPLDTIDIRQPPAAAVADYGSSFVAWIGSPSGMPNLPGTLYGSTVDEIGTFGSMIEIAAQGVLDGWETTNSHPAVAIAGNGNLTFVWRQDQVAGFQNGGYSNSVLMLRRYTYDLQPLGEAVPITMLQPFARAYATPRVAVDGRGGITVAWSGKVQPDGREGIYARRLDEFGMPLGEVFEVAVDEFSDNTLTGLAVDADGDTTLAWTEMRDGQKRAMSRRYRGYGQADLSISIGNQPTVAQGGEIYFGVHAINDSQREPIYSGESAATGVVLDLALPAGAALLSVTGPRWACEGATTLHCVYEDVLEPTQFSEQLEIRMQAPQTSGALQLSATVSGEQDDPELGNNQNTATIQVADQSPDPFGFQTVTGVARGSQQVSAPVTISGIEGAVSVYVSNGQYSINGGAFVVGYYEVYPGDQLRLRHTASGQFGTAMTTTIYVGQGSASFTSITEAADTSPAPFTFAAQTGVARGSLQTSNEIVVAQINAPAAISVTGGSYSIDGAAFRTSAGTVNAGQRVRVQHTSAAQFSAGVVTTLSIGDQSAQFASTTEAEDVTPEAFAFVAQNGVARSSSVTSNEVTVAGINSPAPVAVSGGSYSIDGGAFISAAGTVSAGQRVRVRHTASGQFSTAVQSLLTIGGVSATFVSTTEAIDTTPTAYALVDQVGVATGASIQSAPITVAGINASAAISIAGGSYSINGGPFTIAAGSVNAGDQVRVSHVSASTASTATNSVLTIGGVSDTFTSTTGAVDTTPNAFAFTDVSGARRGREVYSNTLMVSGINSATPATITGTGGAAYSKNGGAYTSAAGTVVNGDTLRLRMTAASTAYGTVSASMTVGGISDTWTVTSGSK